jgi:aldehyde dehydrogenase (NAD+)
MADNTKFFIDGNWVAPLGGQVIPVINPASEEVIGHITLGTAADVDRAVQAARRAFHSYSRTSSKERVELLQSIISVFARRHDEVADLLTAEIGAPRAFAKNLQAATTLAHLQLAIEALQNREFWLQHSDRTIVQRDPIGVVGAITPWNWPLHQMMAKVAPALAVGCTIVHKPSELAPLTAHLMAEILAEAGLPAGVYNLVDGEGREVGRAISSHAQIDMVSFTGSTAAGIDVAKHAADTVKRVHQELGGKSANIVLASADLEKAVTENLYRLTMNTGQSCHAPTRLLVPAGRLEETKKIAKAVAETITVGDPTGDVHMGPLISKAHWERVQSLIQKGEEEGAEMVTGGTGAPAGLTKGFFVKPTVFANVTNDMEIAQTEIFGPVLSIIAYADDDDAIRIANDTRYGLAGFVQAGTDEEAEQIARELQAGMIFLNGAGEDLSAPFGGYKQSGNGREWGSRALDEFLETKAITRASPLAAP